MRLRELLFTRPKLERVIMDYDLYPDVRRKYGMGEAVEELKKHVDYRAPGGDTFSIAFQGTSAGQAQRIGLARALYGNPPIVLLDEPNAHLDASGEGQLVETLVALKARKAAVMIVAHRMGVLSAVDKILVLREGRIEAFGARDEIIAGMTKAPAAPIEAQERVTKRSQRS